VRKASKRRHQDEEGLQGDEDNRGGAPSAGSQCRDRQGYWGVVTLLCNTSLLCLAVITLARTGGRGVDRAGAAGMMCCDGETVAAQEAIRGAHTHATHRGGEAGDRTSKRVSLREGVA